ncbi:MAG TPA: PQQ-dependent sugar dehydrogenase, partial [Tepidisphaeraceae bacterium]|nr:PQQ-dependent sugar dehydrogenase [Tepidisphaeraceae bacterium]
MRCAILLAVMTGLMFAREIDAQTVNDPTLAVNRWTSGFDRPTAGAWLGGGDLLIAEKNTGRVKLVRNRQNLGTVLDLPVNGDSERGLLGMTLSPDFANDRFVYLYYTAAASDGAAPISNKISRYRWTGDELVFNRKIRDLPVLPGANHNGGKMVFDKAGQLYVALGDLNRNERQLNNASSQTIGLAGTVLRLDSAGKSVTTNPFYDPARVGRADEPLNDIFAYGIRNSFGIDLDPVTGDLWQSENGASSYDEINRLRPGANSGWRDFMGPIARSGSSEADLVSLGDAAYYADPRFAWVRPVAPTDVMFFPTNRLGKQHRNRLFAGATKQGLIYRFDLSPSRRTLALAGALADGVADNGDELLDEQDAIVFGQGFGLVSDLFTGPGGMYVLDYSGGTLYRITTLGSAPAG